MAKVACIGAGSWGTAVAGLAALNGNEVVLWCRRSELADSINELGINGEYLPGIRLPEGLRAVGDIHEAMDGADGTEVGGAIKNIIAIAAGIADSMGFGDNAMAALMTRGLAELTRLGVRLGGNPLTFAGLAGMGDMIVTCISRYSRNRRVGKELGKGRRIDDVIAEMNMVAEGVKTCRPILELGRKVDAWMPITEGVVSVIYEGSTPQEMVADILARPAVPETFGIEA